MINEAILNFWTKLRDEDIAVRKGDIVISSVSEFNLTEGKRYEITKINWTDEIAVINDIGRECIYTVEHFRL